MTPPPRAERHTVTAALQRAPVTHCPVGFAVYKIVWGGGSGRGSPKRNGRAASRRLGHPHCGVRRRGSPAASIKPAGVTATVAPAAV